MVKVKLNSFSEKTRDFPQYEDERLSEIFERYYKSLQLPSEEHKKFFKIYINGEEIDRELWAYIKPKPDVTVLIALVPQGGDTGRILGQIALTVAIIAVNAVAGPYWAAATAIIGSLAVNQLFPPPALDLGGANKGYNQEESQMYTISNQSNQQKKYGVVPKVYGEHRFFPNVAANPYTSFEVDKKTGELVQYFYAVYDLGFGPMVVNEVKIGDTNIEFFEDAYYRLVDFNKPSVDEGIWDEELTSNLAYYKGDNTTESVNAAINTNQDDPGASFDDYTVIRNADENPNDYDQEITLTFGFAQGLTTFGTNGKRRERSVEFNIQFAEVGTENWQAFNNENYVSDFSAVGDTFEIDEPNIQLFILERDNAFQRYHENWDVLESNSFPYQFRHKYPLNKDGFIFYGDFLYAEDRYGIKKGRKFFYSGDFININDYITYGGNRVGRVKSRTDIGGGGFRYELYSGVPYDLYLFRDFTRWPSSGGFTTYTSYYFDTEDRLPPSRKVLSVQNNTIGSFTVRADKTTPVFATVRFVPNTKSQIKVRVQRLRSYGGYSYRVFDDMTWASIQTRLNTNPIVTSQRHVFLEVKIRATDQLNGTISNLSAICKSVLDVYNDSTGQWEKQVTSNPAWVFADILTGAINKRAIAKTRLDTDSLLEWAAFCDEVPTPPPGIDFKLPRYQANFVSDTAITVSQLIGQITSSCQASMNMINGKYGVLVDKLKTIPVQLFTPRNSWNFSSARTYSNLPDAIRVKFIDPGREWGVYEELVYADGKDESTAVKFEDLDTFACTNFEQAWRFGRYFLVSSILRQENISIDVDFENLVCTRGDFVKLQHDVMKAGGRPARVKSVSGNEITIDDAFITETGINYGYTFRNATSGILSGSMTITSSKTAELDNDIPEVGDLIVWGELEKITIDCLVKSILPNDDMTATVLLIEKADEVYEAESTSTLPIYDPQLVTGIDAETEPPPAVENLVVFDSSYRCGNGDYVYFVQLVWEDAVGAVVDKYEIYVDKGSGYELDGFTSNQTYEYVVDPDFLEIEHNFKVVGVAANGSKLSLADVPFVLDTPLPKTTPPSDVPGLFINILGESLQLDWDLVEDCDINNYLIRYSPNVNASWSSSIPLQVVDKETSLATSQARVGAYFVKAVDWAGNESAVAAQAVTSIPALVNLNIIEETNDFPDLLGEQDRVQAFGEQLILQEVNNGDPALVEYESVGYYYYKDLLDLGEIYTVRLQSLIEAEGFSTSDLMVNWPTLADVDALSSSSVSDWSVETEYRATNNFNTISEWNTMAEIDPISEGIQADFTPWRKFTIGDFTGRIFQFRLKLISNVPNITPRVFDGVIKSDMPDRIENYNDLNTVSGEYVLTYAIPFKGPGTSPNIQITQDDASQGDYYKITNKTLEGFTIKFYDKNDSLVDRQFDVLVKGYGRKQDQVI